MTETPTTRPGACQLHDYTVVHIQAECPACADGRQSRAALHEKDSHINRLLDMMTGLRISKRRLTEENIQLDLRLRENKIKNGSCLKHRDCKISYDGEWCPLCAADTELRDYERTVARLRDENELVVMRGTDEGIVLDVRKGDSRE